MSEQQPQQVLYRKYRSTHFGDVIGQDHVVATLMNAIASNRVAHAYLFTGPRGTGKTSVARLLARALNCTAESKPCNPNKGELCPSCQAAINTSLDVIEMDAASNRRIEEIRDLRDKINLAPTMGRYKVYIIDEVHMLTTEAFNALLKTLEEPPAHAVLILATTEVHKLPETIISRTQRFSFNPISMPDLVSRLTYIAAQEELTAEPAAIELIASAARGGFRDAISLLDQVAASGASQITPDVVRSALGWSDPKLLESLLMALGTGEVGAILARLDELSKSGAQSGQLAQELVRLIRGIMITKAASGRLTGAAEKLGESWSLPKLAEAIEALVAVGKSSWPEVLLEAALVTLASPPEVRLAKPSPVAQPAAQSERKAPIDMPKELDNLWPKALMVIKERHNALFAIVSSCQFAIEGDLATLTSKFNFHRQRLEEPKNRLIIEQALTKVYGKSVRVVARTAGTPPAKVGGINPSAELVSSALEILGGERLDGEN